MLPIFPLYAWEKDNNESKSIVSDIKALLSDELPYYPLFYKTYGAIQAKQMKGKTTPLFNDYLNGCRKWRCEFIKVEKEKPSD